MSDSSGARGEKTLRADVEVEAVFFDGVDDAAEARAALDQQHRQIHRAKAVARRPGRKFRRRSPGCWEGRARCEKSERLREQRALGQALFFEIRIEDHGDVANEDAAERRDADFVAARGATRPSSTKGCMCDISAAKYSSKLMPKSAAISSLRMHGVAEQAADDGAAQAIVFAQAIAAHGGDAAALDGFACTGRRSR